MEKFYWLLDCLIWFDIHTTLVIKNWIWAWSFSLLSTKNGKIVKNLGCWISLKLTMKWEEFFCLWIIFHISNTHRKKLNKLWSHIWWKKKSIEIEKWKFNQSLFAWEIIFTNVSHLNSPWKPKIEKNLWNWRDIDARDSFHRTNLYWNIINWWPSEWKRNQF
jgi:hypothetical protein